MKSNQYFTLVRFCLNPALLTRREDGFLIPANRSSTPSYLLELVHRCVGYLNTCIEKLNGVDLIEVGTQELGQEVDTVIPIFLEIYAVAKQHDSQVSNLLDALKEISHDFFYQATKEHGALFDHEDKAVELEDFEKEKNSHITDFLRKYGGEKISSPLAVEFPLLSSTGEQVNITIDKQLPPNPDIFLELPKPFEIAVLASGINVDKMQATLREPKALTNLRDGKIVDYTADTHDILERVGEAALKVPRKAYVAKIETRRDEKNRLKKYLVNFEPLTDEEIQKLIQLESTSQSILS